ncbi:hypothetical protein [Rachiplusia nu nucleopolyhedrovirus]|uniref:Uncharacterized protein n=1 Tax=Rachiplusia nu nucleopolyhedrovirus TaxID=2605775 RepID=A0AAE6M7J3_9ABAC|nr:hypothetical protein QKQ55_gp033 [Rachiplusia nu nucleopolyhedrovirus]QEI03655.1 hypothetical protein [Rachiplusia nu nucleopolyhedrovirus]
MRNPFIKRLSVYYFYPWHSSHCLVYYLSNCVRALLSKTQTMIIFIYKYNY